jgi:ABC-type polysaccharide/polyol phosphate export permease
MSGASSWVRVIMMINPMTYAMSALRQVLYLGVANPIPDVCSLTTALCVTILFGLGMIAVSVVLVSRRAL